eukprot:GFKZ01010598.1.p2 GENE.GFKZ01010598.1~~GFKZ01010598.1.p2  ORF type:complete len:103 (+),score=1.56 GFKZ01010598.1:1978-2286(+)
MVRSKLFSPHAVSRRSLPLTNPHMISCHHGCRGFLRAFLRITGRVSVSLAFDSLGCLSVTMSEVDELAFAKAAMIGKYIERLWKDKKDEVSRRNLCRELLED